VALNEFTCRAGGSNLNAGTLDGSAEAATTPLVTYTAGSFDAATNVFTPASGNPVSDGVAVGHWLSLVDTGTSLRTTGATNSRASTPDSVPLSITGDLDVRAKVALDDWTPSGVVGIVGHWGTVGERSWVLRVTVNGALNLLTSVDGTALTLNVNSTANTGFVDGSTNWIRATIDVDNGAGGNDIRFYTSTDGASWTQLGATVTTAGVASLFNSGTTVKVGDMGDSGNVPVPTGNVYRAEVYDGIAGTLRASPSFESQSAGTTSFSDAQGNTWTVGAAASIVAATTAGLVAKITARDATTITVSSTIRFGGVTTGTRDCRVGGAWAGPGGTSGFPLTFASGGATTSFRINLKNDQTYNITSHIDVRTAGPGIIQGYTSSFNDRGRFTLDGGTSGASYDLLSFTGTNWQLWDFVVQNNGATGNEEGLSGVGTGTIFGRGKVQNIRRVGIELSGSQVYVRDVEVTNCNISGAGGSAAVRINAGCVMERCYVHDNTPAAIPGIRVNGTGDLVTIFDSIIESNGNNGLDLAGNGGAVYLFNCDFYANGGDGVAVSGTSGTSRLVAENCNFVLNGGYGVDASGAGQRTGRLVNCGFGSGAAANTSGTVNALRGIDEEGTITYASGVTPWADPAAGNFTVTLAAAKDAGRGNLPTAGVTTSAPVVGAAQPTSSTGGGGGGAGKVRSSGSG
jgi:hypothetical protein